MIQLASATFGREGPGNPASGAAKKAEEFPETVAKVQQVLHPRYEEDGFTVVSPGEVLEPAPRPQYQRRGGHLPTNQPADPVVTRLVPDIAKILASSNDEQGIVQAIRMAANLQQKSLSDLQIKQLTLFWSGILGLDSKREPQWPGGLAVQRATRTFRTKFSHASGNDRQVGNSRKEGSGE